MINDNAPEFLRIANSYQKAKKVIPRKMAIYAVNHFKRNFKLQGFQDGSLKKWPARAGKMRKGNNILIKSGRLRRGVKILRTSGSRTVIGVGAEIPYARIHNEGGKIKITAKMRRYFFAMYYSMAERDDTGKVTSENDEAKFWKNMALTKKTHIDVPKRQFIGPSIGLEKGLDKLVIKELQMIIQ